MYIFTIYASEAGVKFVALVASNYYFFELIIFILYFLVNFLYREDDINVSTHGNTPPFLFEDPRCQKHQPFKFLIFLRTPILMKFSMEVG